MPVSLGILENRIEGHHVLSTVPQHFTDWVSRLPPKLIEGKANPASSIVCTCIQRRFWRWPDWQSRTTRNMRHILELYIDAFFAKIFLKFFGPGPPLRPARAPPPRGALAFKHANGAPITVPSRTWFWGLYYVRGKRDLSRRASSRRRNDKLYSTEEVNYWMNEEKFSKHANISGKSKCQRCWRQISRAKLSTRSRKIGL